MKTLSKLGLAVALVLAGTALDAKPAKHATPAKKPMQAGAKLNVTFPPISPTAPPDIPVRGGAANATITDAATFAWQEFIAFNWPAVTQTGAPHTRGVANASVNFGSDAQGAPLVWETMRSKVETFPGVGYPPGYPTVQAIVVPDHGYDHLPVYTYGTRSTDGNGNQNNPGGTPLAVGPCSGQPPVAQPAWINLDEVDQIGEDSMYAGVIPAGASPVNSQPQLIRFLAKGNRTFYDYVAGNQYWYKSQGYNTAAGNFANAASSNTYPAPGPTVSLPTGTVLVKAAWRELGPNDNAANFHTQNVRYYEKDSSGAVCYRENTWGLIALHIIQKTSTAPYFIFATFEYTANIVDTAGNAVENINGGYNGTMPANPLNPGVNYWDADSLFYDANNPKGTTTVPPPAGQPLPVAQAAGASCDLSNNQNLYYINAQFGSPASQQLPAGNFCVTRRYFSIPQQVQDVNAAAHTALSNYGAPGRWQNYKLVNVQWQPFNQSDIDTSGTNLSRQGSTFYQANSVVETDNTLQQFFGGLTGTGLKSNYQGAAPGPRNYNVYLPPSGSVPSNQFTRIDMGGCMGCHGRAQFVGDDFSFTLRGGPVKAPETPDADDATRIQLLRSALQGHL
jgi:hypothetical protein